jgi:hypothetical protein
VKEATCGVVNVARPTGQVLTNWHVFADLSIRVPDLIPSGE